MVVLDFEATCDADSSVEPVEIIEFPSILYSPLEDEVIDEFTAFVRPMVHPELTEFCRDLTGIAQRDVAEAQPFPAVFADHRRWLAGHGFDVDRDGQFDFVTCGDWDLRTMLPQQVSLVAPDGSGPPPAYRTWINVKRVMRATHGSDAVATLPAMLEALDLPLVGRHHRGIDDCRNILAIVRALLSRGVLLSSGRARPRSRRHVPDQDG